MKTETHKEIPREDKTRDEGDAVETKECQRLPANH